MLTAFSTEIGVALPSGWQQLRAKHILREIVERSAASSADELLTVSQYSGVTPTNAEAERSGDLSTYKRCRVGDLVVNTMLAWNGSLGVAPRDGIVSPAYAVYRFCDSTEAGFFSRMLRTPHYRRQIAMRSSGVVESRLRLYPADLYNLPLLVPPLVQQRAIVRFLEDRERDIEHYLATKRRMIEVLEEQRVLVVERVLQRSTSAQPSTRPVPWFGDVPSTWRTSRLKHVASHIVDCLHETPDYLQDGEYPAVRTADVVPGRLDLHRAKRVDHATFIRRIDRLKPQGGDIVYSREGERFGIAASVPTGVNLCVSQRMMHFRIRPEFDAAYIMWLLNSRAVYLQASVDQNGATAPHVNVERIRNFLFVIPDLSTQREMVRMVEHEVSELDAAVLVLEREIAAMEEYRTRLIADAVTGQIDLRSLG